MDYKEYALDEATVEAASARVQDYLNAQKMERRSVQRIRLTAEELLLNILSHCGRGVRVSIGLGKQFGRQMLRLRYEGEAFDPVKNGENPLSDEILRSLGVLPSWSYRGRMNTVSMTLSERPKRGSVFYILLAVAAAVVLGFVGRLFPEALRRSLTDILLTPLSNGFLGLMKTFSGILIMLTICSGILGMGDSATLGQRGKLFALRFIGISFLLCAAVMAAALPLLHIDPGAILSQGDSSGIAQISQMIFAILPSDPVEPFRTGNTLQLIVIALLIGVGLLAIGERGKSLRCLVEESTVLLQRLVSGICALVPLYVFSMLLRQLWSGDASALLSVWKLIVMALAAEVVFSAAYLLIAALRLKINPLKLLKKILPPTLVAFTTSSSLAALTLSLETCERRLGVKNSTVAFAYPLGSVIFMPGCIFSFTVFICFLAQFYQVAVSPAWCLLALITVTLLVIAMPPIPGGGVLVFTIMFSTLGIPAEALVMVTAAETVLEFFATGSNITLLLLEIACGAERLGDLDRAALAEE